MDRGIDWTIIRPIRQGSLIDVYEIRTLSDIICIGEYIRLPVQTDEPGAEDRLKKRTEDLQYLRSLEHENLVKVLDIRMILPDHTIVIFTDLINGQRLDNILKKLIEQGVEGLNEDKIKHYSKQMCKALQYLHHINTSGIHRIISSFSVTITEPSDNVKLVDYGASVQLLGVTSIARSECSRGLPHYMAPELLLGGDNCKYSSRTDIWAFGCVVYEMATGRRPNSNCGNMMEIVDRVSSQGAPALPQTASNELQRFYAACTAKDKKERKTAAELLGHEFLL